MSVSYNLLAPKNGRRHFRVSRLKVILAFVLGAASAIILALWYRNHRHKQQGRESRLAQYNGKIVLPIYTKWFGEERWEGDEISCPHLPKTCVFSHDRSLIDDRSLIIFHAPDHNVRDLPERKDGQKWILWSAEAPINDPWQLTADNVRPFDMSMNYRLDSDFPWTYLGSSVLDAARAPLPSSSPSSRSSDSFVVWIASNCKAKNGRHHFVKELQKYLQVDCLGSCLNNAPSLSRDDNIVETLRKYKFYLSLENSNCVDYVSEKFSNAIAAGVVPVVDGPKDYRNFEPMEGAVIYADQFSSVKLLADHLIMLNGNDTLYRKHLEYKEEPSKLSPHFLRTWNPINGTHSATTKCKLCQRAIEMREKDHAQHDSPLHTTALLPDRSCSIGKWNYLAES